jgi:hypothetical protein
LLRQFVQGDVTERSQGQQMLQPFGIGFFNPLQGAIPRSLLRTQAMFSSV